MHFPTPQPTLVFLTDFGWKARFVGSMKGVAFSISPSLRLFDLSHDITPYHIAEAALTLGDTLAYWPEGTVFVSVVDPGVGTQRQSVVALTNSGHYIVTPDNGTLTWIVRTCGLAEIRLLDESTHRLPGSDAYHTFHGRDVYTYTAARLAAGKLAFDQIGPQKAAAVQLDWPTTQVQAGRLEGSIIGVEAPYGNLWTDLTHAQAQQAGLSPDPQPVYVQVHGLAQADPLEVEAQWAPSFGHVPANALLLYLDSAGRLGLALNGASLAAKWQVAPTQFYSLLLTW